MMAKALEPAPRGRKPKATAPAPDMSANDDINGMAINDVLEADAPARGRPGRTPNGSAGTLTELSLEKNAGSAGEMPASMTSEAEPEAEASPFGDGPVGDRDDGKTVMDEAVTTPQAKPAAQWDQRADTVSFDWPEIERTASQEGPNQGMAKLLVAARAEGANSRWPL